MSLTSFLEQARGSLTSSARNDKMRSRNDCFEDKKLFEHIQSLIEQSKLGPPQYFSENNAVLPHFLHHFDLLCRYTSEIYESVDETLARDFIGSIYKIFALHSGSQLAYSFLTLSSKGALNKYLMDLDKTMVAGI
jgi:hypothetical protein